MNSINLIGRITKELELRKTNNGKPVCNFSLAVYRDKDNTDFINCIVWNNQAENLCKYQAKGSLIGVSGALRIEKYEDNEGKKRYNNYVLVNSIEYLSGKKETEETNDDPTETLGDSFTAEQLDDSFPDLPF